MLEGTSGVDVPRLYVDSISEAEGFIESYGYDWSIAVDRDEIEKIRRESIRFIEDELFREDDGMSFPLNIRNERDVRKLLLWASNDTRDERQQWSCALLRVMHTFAHCGSYFNEKYSEQIRSQIKERFRPHLFEGDSGLRLGAGPAAIPLVTFEVRGQKTRRSLALKLLYKRENIGSDIFDWVGVRFVTADRYDALRVVRYLREGNVINFMQVRPGRSRNTLFDPAAIQDAIDGLEDRIRSGKLPDYQAKRVLRETINEMEYPSPPVKSHNPLSSVAYHSIQFTCMQRIRVRDRESAMLRSFVDRLPLQDTGVYRTISNYTDRIEDDEDVRFLFPFEVQILDRHSYELSRSGLASHEVYKDRQREVVRDRVLGTIIDDDAKRQSAE
jgi:uncharacterized protein (TIGR04562 family)